MTMLVMFFWAVMVIRDTQGCTIQLKGFADSDPNPTGYTKVNDVTVHDILASGVGYYLAAIDNECKVADVIHIPTLESPDDFGQQFSDVVLYTPRGYILIGVSAGDALRGMNNLARRAFTYLGVDTSRLQTGDVLVFTARKGFPNEVKYQVQPAGTPSTEFTVNTASDLHDHKCFPPLTYAYRYFDWHRINDIPPPYFTLLYGHRVTCTGQVRGWHYKAFGWGRVSFSIWRMANTSDSIFNITEKEAVLVGVNHIDVNQTRREQYYCVPPQDRIHANSGDMVGVYYPSTGYAPLNYYEYYPKYHSAILDPDFCGVSHGYFGYYDFTYCVYSSARHDNPPSPVVARQASLSQRYSNLALQPVLSPSK